MWLIRFLISLFSQKKVVEMEYLPLDPLPEPTPTTAPIVEVPTALPSNVLYETAKAFLGRDASPRDVAPDEFGCAESVNEIFKSAFGSYIIQPGISTTKLYLAMLHDTKRFAIVKYPIPGCIIISPTDYGNGNLKNGHVGIVGKYGIMSNDSATGLWKENYTLDKWRTYYHDYGGFPIVLFRPV